MKGWSTFLAIVLCAGALRAAELPRYALPVGRAMTYSVQSVSKSQGAGMDMTSQATWRAIVVSENADGSRRVILRMSASYTQGARPAAEERVTIGYVDLFPDGRFLPNPTIGPQMSFSNIFPRLPDTEAQADSSWEYDDKATLTVTAFKRAVTKEAGIFNFTANQSGPLSRIYLTTNDQSARFDLAKGMLVVSDIKSSQGYGINSTGTGTVQLEKDEMIPREQASVLAKDYDALIQAQSLVNGLMDNVAEHPSQASLLLQELNAKVAALGTGVQSDEVKRQFAELGKRNESLKSYVPDTASRLQQILNRPAAEWAAKDWDGADFSQRGLRGRVVVMDFWYRGCGWCMYAMPQIRQLALDYKDKPVAVLGMNTDQKEEDARLVIRELDMHYPQIRMPMNDVDQKFGIRAFPTTLVIDQQGVVRAAYIGYSPDLGEKLARKIDSLLKPG